MTHRAADPARHAPLPVGRHGAVGMELQTVEVHRGLGPGVVAAPCWTRPGAFAQELGVKPGLSSIEGGERDILIGGGGAALMRELAP